MRALERNVWNCLAATHLLVAAVAMPVGALLCVWPSGSLLGLPLQVLAPTPFTNFLLPGLVFYASVGVSNMLFGYLALKREPGAARISFFIGLVLLGWIITALAIAPGYPLYPSLFIIPLLPMLGSAALLWYNGVATAEELKPAEA